MNFSIDNDGILHFGSQLCISYDLKREVIKEEYGTAYTIHPSSTKMYQDLKETYW